MTPETKQDIRNALRKIADNHAAAMAALHRSINELSAQLEGDPPKPKQPMTAAPQRNSKHPYMDAPMLSVIHSGKSCFLGNSVPYRLLAKLLERPNRYFRYDELFAGVWNGIRSETTVRSAVKVLRAKLREARLHELAEAIDGSEKRHYGLMLDRMGR